ncbi:MAG: FHA domain-containing protein [Planctomycetes bacterium]|nr:FHA domain-containing protein [Planctomycetota bacterium]
MKISLVVLSAGSAAGKALVVNDAQFLIGRDPQCNLRPASAMISKRHCAVLVKGEQAFLRDFDSTNGTSLNDTPVKGEVLLKDGDVLKVGPLSFKIVIERTKSAPTKPTPPPKPRNAAETDEDAAAALLSIDDESGDVSMGTKETAEDAALSGSTVMDIPAFVPPGDSPGEAKSPEAKPEEKKDGPKKHAQGAAQDAARAILEKLKQGKRK